MTAPNRVSQPYSFGKFYASDQRMQRAAGWTVYGAISER
jgi:hypothetical protein